MSLTGIKNHFVNWREWELNPVVIKELRQGVRSWTVTGMLLLFLVVLFITSLGFLITQSFDVDSDLQLGGTVFSFFVVILAGASILFIPLYTAVRVAFERQENNPDLLYVTTLSPFRIIFGKFLCSAYVVLLFFSACMPVMAFTNLLRGVDLPTVFYILFLLFVMICGANMAAIFFACLPVSRAFKILIAIGGVAASFVTIVSAVGFALNLMRSGVGAMMAGRDFWIGTLTYTGIVSAVAGLFFVLSVALISPPSANRAFPVRAYLTAAWLLGGLLCLGWVIHSGDAEVILAWVYPTFIIMMLALLASIGNADLLSLRVQRTIPRSKINRLPAFLFFNGAAGGLLWVGAVLVVTGFAAWSILLWFPVRVGAPSHDLRWFAITAAYAFAYSLTALFIQRRFMARRPPKLASLLAVLLAGGWAVAPSIFLFFVNRLTWQSIEGFQPGNIFNFFSLREEHDLALHVPFAFGWLAIAWLINGRWFMQRVKNFQPPAPAAAEKPGLPQP